MEKREKQIWGEQLLKLSVDAAVGVLIRIRQHFTLKKKENTCKSFFLICIMKVLATLSAVTKGILQMGDRFENIACAVFFEITVHCEPPQVGDTSQ